MPHPNDDDDNDNDDNVDNVDNVDHIRRDSSIFVPFASSTKEYLVYSYIHVTVVFIHSWSMASPKEGGRAERERERERATVRGHEHYWPPGFLAAT